MCVPVEGCTREGWGFRRGSEEMVRFRTYNIRSGRNRGLESALCRLAQGQVYCGVLH